MSILFLILILTILAIISLSIFFIIFGAMKKMYGFIIAGVAMLLLFIVFFVMIFLMNFAVIK